MINIFEGAKFRDKFLTRAGEIAIYHCYDSVNDRYKLINPKHTDELLYRKDGTCSLEQTNSFSHDIVSRYNESIDEEKLDELAYEAAPDWIKSYWAEPEADAYREGFKDGLNTKIKL